MNSVLVSVILPTHNRANTILSSIQSVLTQTYTNIELIVIDDCSNDESQILLKSIFDKRIKIIRNVCRVGASASRNIGIRISSGQFVAFQDSDDYWHERKLDVQMKAFLESSDQYGVVYCSMLRSINNVSYLFPRRGQGLSGDLSNILLEQNLVGTPTAVIRAKYLEKCGLFDETLPRLQDWDLFIRLSRECKFRFIDQPFVQSSLMSDSISANPFLLDDALERLVAKYEANYMAGDRYLISRRFYRLGYLSLTNGTGRFARKYLWGSLKSNRIAPKTVFLLIASLFGTAPIKVTMKLSRFLKSVFSRNK